jgi:hypothetical protein
MFQSGSGPTTQIGLVNRNKQRCEGSRGVAGDENQGLAYKMVYLVWGHV